MAAASTHEVKLACYRKHMHESSVNHAAKCNRNQLREGLKHAACIWIVQECVADPLILTRQTQKQQLEGNDLFLMTFGQQHMCEQG